MALNEEGEKVELEFFKGYHEASNCFLAHFTIRKIIN